MTAGDTTATVGDEQRVLTEVSEMIRELLEQDGVVDTGDIGMDSRFTADLDMESIDLVALSTLLHDRYGEQVNFAEFVAQFDLDEIIELRVGQLVHYICRCLGGEER